MAEASFTLRAVDATKQAFANVQNSLAKLQQSSQTAAGFMKKAFDPRAIGAGLAASLGVSLIGVIDLAIKKLIELAMRAHEVGKILTESTKTITKMREDAAFAELDPQGQIAAIDEKRKKNAAEILRLKKATQAVESQMPSVLQGESFSPVAKSNLGTVAEAEKLSKMLEEDAALENDRRKLSVALERQSLEAKLELYKGFTEFQEQQRQAGIKEEQDALEISLEQYKAVQEFLNQQLELTQEQIEKNKELGKSLSDSVMTPMEKYIAALERIDLLHASDTIDTETMIRLTGEAGAAFAATSGDVEDMASRLSMVNEEANKTIPAMSQLAQMSNDAGSMIAQGFEDAILSGQKLGEVVRSLGRDLVRLVFSQLVTQPLAAGIGGAIKGAFGVRAMGGPVASGSPYVVGEKGPELFVPHASGTIVPNNKMGGGSGSGGGSVTVNYNIAAGVSRAELVPILDQERRRLKAEIPDMVRRGGGYRAAFA
jgi:hypothetical protein